MYNLGASPIVPRAVPLIHPVINFPAAGGIRARPPSSVDPIRYPQPIQTAYPAGGLWSRSRPQGRVRRRCRPGDRGCPAPGLSLGPEDYLVEQARAAVAWIQGKVREFFDLERKLSLTMHQAAQVEGRARQAGHIDAADNARTVRLMTLELLKDYDRTKGQLEDLLARVPGLGVIPIAVLIAAGATIIAVASAMAAILRRADVQEEALKLVAAGELSTSEFNAMNLERSSTLFSGLGMGAGIGGLVALTVAIAVGLPIVADAFTARGR